MKNIEVEKSQAHIIVEIIESIPGSIMIKTMIKKATGNISAYSFFKSEVLTGKPIPFDTFVEIVNGKAEIAIDGISNLRESFSQVLYRLIRQIG